MISDKEILELKKELEALKPIKRSTRKRRADCTVQEWTEHERALERSYDAKRRAKKREQGAQIPIEERRLKRKPRPDPPSSDKIIDIIVSAVQGLEMSASKKDDPVCKEIADKLKQQTQALSCLRPKKELN